jgi:hypothetical protein
MYILEKCDSCSSWHEMSYFYRIQRFTIMNTTVQQFLQQLYPHTILYFGIMSCHIVWYASCLQVMFLPLRFLTFSWYMFYFPHACYMPHPPWSPWSNYPKNTRWTARIMKASVMVMYLCSCCFAIHTGRPKLILFSGVMIYWRCQSPSHKHYLTSCRK